MKQEFEAKEAECLHLSRDQEKMLADAGNLKQNLVKEVDLLKERLKAKESECSRMSAEKDQLLVEIDQSKRELENQHNDLEKEKTELENSRHTETEIKMKELQTMLDEKEKVVEEMQRELAKNEEHLKQVIPGIFIRNHEIKVRSVGFLYSYFTPTSAGRDDEGEGFASSRFAKSRFQLCGIGKEEPSTKGKVEEQGN